MLAQSRPVRCSESQGRLGRSNEQSASPVRVHLAVSGQRPALWHAALKVGCQAGRGYKCVPYSFWLWISVARSFPAEVRQRQGGEL